MKIVLNFFYKGAMNLMLALCLITPQAQAVDATVNFNQAIKTGVNPEAAGINLCWLLDSDLHRNQSAPMSQALSEMRVGILRFPYGHLADNYLWNAGPHEPKADGLQPKVASMSLPPGNWSWAVKPDGSMPSAMDFDEYMALCQKIGAKALVCVNVLAFKYPDGPTYEQLKSSAVAWVKYARQRHYQVAYWQIGNEVDHGGNKKLLPMNEYVALYEDFARAMKEADPNAQVGPGILSSPAYDSAISRKCPELVDFACVHQYMYAWQKTCSNYVGWRDCSGSFIKNINQAETAFKSAGLPQLKLLVTETGVTGGHALGEINNTYKALWCFEVLMNEISDPAVAYSFYWGTHSPWSYQGDDVEPENNVGLALHLQTNVRTPTGEMLRLINQNLLSDFVSVPRVIGRVRCYAMRSKDGRQRSLFLLNKDDRPMPVEITLAGAITGLPSRGDEFAGKSPEDVAPVIRQSPKPILKGNALQTTLAPLSLTILRWDDTKL